MTTHIREEMGFYVPVTHQEAPPNPKGEEVRCGFFFTEKQHLDIFVTCTLKVAIVTRPEMTVFVRTFGGFAKDK